MGYLFAFKICLIYCLHFIDFLMDLVINLLCKNAGISNV